MPQITQEQDSATKGVCLCWMYQPPHPIVYTSTGVEIAALREDKLLRSNPQVAPVHAPLPSGNVRPHMPFDNGLMFSENPGP